MKSLNMKMITGFHGSTDNESFFLILQNINPEMNTFVDYL